MSADVHPAPRGRELKVGRRSLLTVLAAGGLGVLIAACGSSSKPSVAVSQGLGLAVCMRSHGVPNFPDPGAHGGLFLGSNSGVNPLPPAFRGAQRKCGQGLGGGGPPATSESDRLAALAFSKCMRRHGLGNFPDPTFTAPSGTGPTLVLRGTAFAMGSGLDPRSPVFRQASAACGPGRVP